MLVTGENIFLLYDGLFWKRYVVKGLSGEIYDVVYNIMKDEYTCSCGNIRNTHCYHIEAVKMYNGVNNAGYKRTHLENPI